nr:FCD domain-containing protein [Nereida sp. MMG025]
MTDLQRCFDYRVGLESEAARLAAMHRSEADLDRIKRAFDAMDSRNAAGQTGVEEDFAFHLAVSRASQNRFFVSGLEQVRSHIAQGIAINRTLSLESSGPRLSLVQNEHGMIIEALTQGDADGAAHAMMTHLRNAQSRLFEG